MLLEPFGKCSSADEDFHIDLNQELYEKCLVRTRGVEERDMTDVDEEKLEENKTLVPEKPLLEES